MRELESRTLYACLMEQDETKSEVARLALPLLVERLGGTVEITQDEYDYLPEPLATVPIRQVGSCVRGQHVLPALHGRTLGS